MALDTALYLVTRDIAVRSGLLDSRYRTQDGRFILDNKDLSRVRFTSDEYISGLSGVEKISESEAQALIAANGYMMGDIGNNTVNESTETVESEQEENQEQTNEEEG